jgi:hypothetical protein
MSCRMEELDTNRLHLTAGRYSGNSSTIDRLEKMP